jgi:hypothetical protein
MTTPIQPTSTLQLLKLLVSDISHSHGGGYKAYSLLGYLRRVVSQKLHEVSVGFTASVIREMIHDAPTGSYRFSQK